MTNKKLFFLLAVPICYCIYSGTGWHGYIGTYRIVLASDSQDANEELNSPRPLSDVADQLEDASGIPITYEDTIVSWRADLEAHDKGGKLFPKSHSFIVPFRLRDKSKHDLENGGLKTIIDIYNQGNGSTKFATEKSNWGLHITPSKARNSSGEYVKAPSLLDTRINIPVDKRLPSEHFGEICKSITASTRIALDLNPAWIDEYFAANGIRPPGNIPAEHRDEFTISWGASELTAREAIISLLEQSSSTLTWRLYCDTASCTLNMLNLNIVNGSRRTPLVYDRRPVRMPIQP